MNNTIIIQYLNVFEKIDRSVKNDKNHNPDDYTDECHGS